MYSLANIKTIATTTDINNNDHCNNISNNKHNSIHVIPLLSAEGAVPGRSGEPLWGLHGTRRCESPAGRGTTYWRTEGKVTLLIDRFDQVCFDQQEVSVLGAKLE